MKYEYSKYLGIFFLLTGALILFQNLALFQSNIGHIISAVLYSALSIFLFSQLEFGHPQWWWLVLGALFLGLAAGRIAGLIPALEPYAALFGGAALGISFIVFYFWNRLNWWALIPGSIFSSLSLVQIFEINSPAVLTNGILFYGLGFAFLLIFLFPTKFGRLNWAILPASFLLIIGVTASNDQTQNVISFLGPIILVISGGLVLFLSFRKSKSL